MERSVDLPIHKHPLYHSSRFINGRCRGCKQTSPIYSGYRCNDSDCNHVWYHKECGESLPEINHPSHLEHPLCLIDYRGSGTCAFCGAFLFGPTYHCWICAFNIDIACARKQLPPLAAIENPKCHNHSLVLLEKQVKKDHCGVCKKTVFGMYPYVCLECDVYFHVECINIPREVNHSSHTNHTLELFGSESLPDSAQKTCLLCDEGSDHLIYHCSVCNFSICVYCARNPPPLAIEHLKTHEHMLTLLPRRVKFICNACGTKGDGCPYFCLECGYLIHRKCIDSPRVININRHDHRISLTHHLGLQCSECGVCRQSVNGYYGGYSCSLCPNYVVHPQCAMKGDVWDGTELEGTPEDSEQDTAPFEVVDDNTIKHFSHENHNLMLNKNGIITQHDEITRCQACVLPLSSDPSYSCGQCDYVLHETCANLPRKKRHVFNNKPFTLHTGGKDSSRNWFECDACRTISNGFRYVSGDWILDVHCGSLSEPLLHDGHSHPLYYYRRQGKSCRSCHNKVVKPRVLCCDTCDFDLDFYCANLPKTVKHCYDEHPLSLCHGEDDVIKDNKYWCDICETETDPKKWFYTCYDCGVTLHVKCVLGDFSRLMPGRNINVDGREYEVVPNSKSSRPFCDQCHSRCKDRFILKAWNNCNVVNCNLCFDVYICSRKCRQPFHLRH
ncbi:unnamed protein product [Arabidopsis thaliana]|uniref:Cysteine/Histidine-rich C1 domain family protein n=1 Tax=Arabidopsis thaliana TaxID=3702 RepID=A0A654FFU8_ARATH|nr:unnamed protein product [Arabidopsis thaliana]